MLRNLLKALTLFQFRSNLMLKKRFMALDFSIRILISKENLFIFFHQRAELVVDSSL